MIKLSTSISKKMPLPDVEFSSCSSSAGIEVEMPSGSTGEEILDRYRKLYALLEKAVDEQLEPESSSHLQAPSGISGKSGDQGPDSAKRARKATEAQISAIRAIAAEKGLSDADLTALIEKHAGASGISELTIRQASELISALKNNGKARSR